MGSNNRQKLEPFKPGCLDALAVEETIREEARALGLRLMVFTMVSGGEEVARPTLHCRFDSLETGRRVLDYWPGSGTCWGASAGRGKAANPREALRIAARLVAQETHQMAQDRSGGAW